MTPAGGATRPVGAVLATNGRAGGAAGLNDAEGTASLAAHDAAIGNDAAMGKRAGNGRSGRVPGPSRRRPDRLPGGPATPAMIPAPGTGS